MLAYLPWTGEVQHPCRILRNPDDIDWLYTEAARRSGYYNALSRANKLTTWGFGTSEAQQNPRVRAPQEIYWVGDPAKKSCANAYFPPAAPVPIAITRQQFLDSFYADTADPLYPQGTWVSPSYVRQAQVMQRLRSPSSGASSLDGEPFHDFLPNGLLDAEGYVEIANALGPVAAPYVVKAYGIAASDSASTQHLWLYSGRGSGVAVRCAHSRTLVGLNKIDLSIRWIMKRDGCSRNVAIAEYSKMYAGARNGMLCESSPGPPLCPWLTFVVRPIDDSDWAAGTRVYALDGLHESAQDGPAMWKAACQSIGIRSITNPTRPLNAYTTQDICEVYIQCVTRPDFMVTTKNPWAKLAHLQNFETSGQNDTLNAQMLGEIGSATAPYDLLQALCEHHPGGYSPELTSAWWRDVYYKRSSSQTMFPLFDSTSMDPATLDDISYCRGPFYIRDGKRWVSDSLTNPYSLGQYESARPIVRAFRQLNFNYLYYTLQQIQFTPSPLRDVNPTGGRIQYLGTYDLDTGTVLSVSDTTVGNPVGSQYPGVSERQGLPPTLPALFPPGNASDKQVAVANQFFMALSDSGPSNPHGKDANAPDVVISPGQWIVFDTQAQRYVVTDAWPMGQKGTPRGVSEIYSIVPQTPYGDSVTLSEALWDRSVPGSMIAANIANILAATNW